MRPSLAELFVVLRGLSGLIENFLRIARLCAILIWRTRFLAGSDNVPITATRSQLVAGQMDHRKRRQGHLIIPGRLAIHTRAIAVYDFTVRKGGQWILSGFRSGRLSGLRSPRSLLAGKVLLGETLLPGFCLPIVVAHPATTFHQTRSKLSKHGSCGDDGNLPRSVGVRQNLLVNEVVFFLLVCDDLVKRPVFVEKQIRVTVA